MDTRDDFVRWLCNQEERGDAVGDLAHDVVRELRSRRLAVTQAQVRERIYQEGGDDAVLQALDDALREWRVRR